MGSVEEGKGRRNTQVHDQSVSHALVPARGTADSWGCAQAAAQRVGSQRTYWECRRVVDSFQLRLVFLLRSSGSAAEECSKCRGNHAVFFEHPCDENLMLLNAKLCEKWSPGPPDRVQDPFRGAKWRQNRFFFGPSEFLRCGMRFGRPLGGSGRALGAILERFWVPQGVQKGAKIKQK